ncbi:MAG: DUF721 domain-containing protein [Nitrospirota bacterium]
MYALNVCAPGELRRWFSEPLTTSLPYNNALVRRRAWWCGVKRADYLLIPFIRELGIEDGVRLAEIKKKWYDLFNMPLSHHMSPFMLSDGELLLNVDSPVWLQELNFYKEDIIKKLSPYNVKSVRFRLGRVSTKIGARGKGQGAKLLTAEEISFIEDVVSPISNDELKETVQRAIKKALITGRTKNKFKL